ncbi:MFS transporter [Haloarcula onubensis]|uniref:MFS transporter n=1 Tax=Haloarcula onubensis TaxID=2950539 RepID=A0ABU2FMG9_9EURY|nr:MFS transporter [Halomicroarcula sp. S3CR25-11]MDS0281954.1 MFS transporter [Halomicroarcula sp. S3CR25-11]
MTTTATGRVPWGSTVLRIALASTLVGVLGVTLVSPLLPAIAEVVGVGDEGASLVITAYTLPGIALSPVAGALADRYGRRPVLVGSLALYALCGTAVAAVTTFESILLLRAMQGVAASGVFSLSVTLLGDAFEGAERTAALGANAAAISIGAAVYPLLGGTLGARSWQTPFLLYAVGIPVALWALYGLGASAPADRENGLSYLRNSVGTLPGRTATAVFGATFTAYVLLFGGVLTAVPFLLAETFGQSSLAIGVILSAAALSTAAVALAGGRLAARLAPARLVAAGYCAYGVGLLTVWLAPGPLVVAAGSLIVGAGQGAVLPAIDGLVSAMAPARYRAGVFGLRTSVVSLGATVGPVAFAAAGSRVGYRPALLVGGSVALVAGVVALWRTA